MPSTGWMERTSPAFRLMIATSWLAPDSCRIGQQEAIRRAGEERPDWAEFLRLVDRHRTQALSWAALKSVPDVYIQEDARRELQKRNDRCRMQAMIQLQMLAGVLRTLNYASIPTMPLKGPLLSNEIYGDAGLRHSKDLDILVSQEHAPKALALLEQTGWRRGAQYSSLTRQAEFNRTHEYHVAYIHAQPHCELELHWRIGNDSAAITAEQMARGVASEWQRCSYLSMNHLDLVRYLSNHGSDHAWFRAKWLGDLARIYTGQSVDWQAALEQARTVCQDRALLLGLRLLSDAYGLTIVDAIDREAEALPPALMDKAVRELTTVTEPGERGTLSKVFGEIGNYGYKRLLRPTRSRWENFTDVALCRVDFKVLRLPDRLFWLYLPLRPFLWAWRHLRDP
jgi:hypothetical protein